MTSLNVDGKDSLPSTQNSEESGDNEDLEIDNSKSVLKKIATLYAEQLMSDLTLEVAGVGYPAHRLILCASSEVFQVMLMNREWSEWRESRIVLQETPSAAAVFPHFLKYFYTGQIKISHLTVLPVLSLADKYNVMDLVSLCLCYMSQHVAQAARRGQLVAWMQYTMACGHEHVAKACQNFVKWNLEWVWSDSSLGELEGDTLVQLLQQSDLVLHNEITLYKLVARWVARQECGRWATLPGGERAALVHAVFAHVRFPMMSPNHLAELLLSPLTLQHKEFFMDRMAIAMSYHSGQYSRVSEVQRSEGGRLLFTPRLYTEDTWGSVLSVERFHSLACYHTRTFMFSTRHSLCDAVPHDKLNEWTVDLYPKGVWFRKSLLIVWAGTYDVPEVVLRTVRISITCQNVPESACADSPVDPDSDYYHLHEPDVRVKIGILVWGVQKGVEHVSHVVERVHRFSEHNRVLNIDGALDFDELNTPLYTPASGSSAGAGSPSRRSPSPAPHPHVRNHGRCPKCLESCDPPEPKHLLGPNRDQLRIQVVILPLTDHCHVGPPPPDAHA